MFKQMTRQYRIAAGILLMKIGYYAHAEEDVLEIDIIEDVDLKYGYEDDDQLTFYPNRMELVAKDPSRKNFDILELSIGEYENTIPGNKFSYAGIEIWLDNVLRFKGYIDDETLAYEEENRVIRFEAVDHCVALNETKVDRSLLALEENGLIRLTQLIHAIYAQVWPDFSTGISPVEDIGNPLFTGIFFKHDWFFRGYNTLSVWKTRDWSNLQDFLQTYFIIDSMQLWGPDRPADTWGELLKLIALQFGAVIGTMDYHKVYFVKRFLTDVSSAENITYKIIGDFYKNLHLPAIRGVKVFNYWNDTQTYEFGNIELTENGEYKYPSRVAELKTYVGSEGSLGGGGTSIFADYSTSYPVYNTVWDPAFGSIATSGHCFQIVGRWYRNIRVRPKSKIDCELKGIDYYLTHFYSLTLPGNLSQVYRPMELTKQLTRLKTKFTGIQAQ